MNTDFVMLPSRWMLALDTTSTSQLEHQVSGLSNTASPCVPVNSAVFESAVSGEIRHRADLCQGPHGLERHWVQVGGGGGRDAEISDATAWRLLGQQQHSHSPWILKVILRSSRSSAPMEFLTSLWYIEEKCNSLDLCWDCVIAEILREMSVIISLKPRAGWLP
ncbi:hypothetical protein RRG08_007937 [Elysia crispata]|uniref:Uncharacterized protein n=1 Tax=Elysia crispata TaxID=231223 RepID=A0AAE0ZQH6_9GAST|nr:hypothetical protein RRG08_007937 [Elysia crispata]